MKKESMIISVLITIIILVLPFVNASLTDNLQFEYSAASWSLPWYAVKQWEVDVCTQHLETALTQNSMNDVFDTNIQSPIYLDTVSIIALKKPAFNGYYYELGWYFQPFSQNYYVNITIEGEGRTLLIKSDKASPDKASDGYKAFPIPCDTTIYSDYCIDFDYNITYATITFQNYTEIEDPVTGDITINKGLVQFIKTKFLVNKEGYS